MVIERRSYEEWVASVDEILRRYRGESTGPSEKLGYDEALALMRKLGVTAGEAMRLLRRPDRKRDRVAGEPPRGPIVRRP
jgi:hypothetical protein